MRSVISGRQSSHCWACMSANSSISGWSITKCCRPSARGDLYSCAPMRSERKQVISKWGFPNRAGIPKRDATICPKKEPLLLPTNTLGIGMLAFAKFCNKSQRFARVKREVGREDFRFTSKCLLQCLGRYAAARSKETVEEKDFCSSHCIYVVVP